MGLEFDGLVRAESVASADEVGSTRIPVRVEGWVGEHREHFCRVSAAAQDDEEVGLFLCV